MYDGNVLLHEWEYTLEDRPKLSVNAKGFVVSDAVEPVDTDKLVSWIFDYNSFVPAAKIVDGNTYSIACDHLGTPVQAYNQTGEKVWERQLDIYGATKHEEGETNFIPFLYQGQFLDSETGLAYNRFRYYSPDTGTYISQDPIGLAGNNPNFYAYVPDSNSWIDPFGLNNVSTGAGRTHVKYSGIKEGKPYHGYASAPTSDNLTDQQIIDRRYGNNFDDFDVSPTPDYMGEGVEGKWTARGLEQRGFEADDGLKGTSNKQSPVGPNNANRQNYLDAADKHNKNKVKMKGCSG
ncbi:RHS repeat-associated core domain-containing protein [uncultured Maribacter sp.]|uniref:RHS repeat domain-containing protein n=1 Tax=uncultured Maribacter sp. TaxID=431308 RepID=UPI00261D1B2C|nr:RHS repeat-associated core domain-containing protein [uncultured Maribacter sp.]